MRVGLISFHSFFQPGGVKRHILGLHKEFKRRGIYSKIIAPRRSPKENYGKEIILLGTSFPVPFSGGISDFTVNFNPLAIERTLKREKFDVLHFHNLGFPSTIQILTSPAAASALNILTFHANIKGSKFLKRFPFLLKLTEMAARWKFNGIIGVAPLTLKPFKKYRGPKIVIPNGVDLEKFNPRCGKIDPFDKLKVSPEQRRGINILFLGRIEERKGLIYLLRAYKILEKKLSMNLRLVVVGKGPLKQNLEKWAKINKLENVVFKGEVNEEKVPLYYSICDIFCSPAIFGESFGLVLVEAMACKKPVVAFANEGYRQVLKNKGARFLVKPRDYKTLAKKLEILIKNKKLREEMSDWGWQEAQKYSWSKIADRILDFYKSCFQEKEKNKRKNFVFEKVLNKDIFSWFKKSKFF